MRGRRRHGESNGRGWCGRRCTASAWRRARGGERVEASAWRRARPASPSPLPRHRFPVTAATGYLWLHRFNKEGLAGLEEKPRKGRPATDTPEQVARVIATALAKPRTLGLPFAAWTLARLAAYLAEQEGIALRRSRREEVLIGQGLRGRKEESWFGERVDPAFAQNRGRSSGSTRRRRRAA